MWFPRDTLPFQKAYKLGLVKYQNLSLLKISFSVFFSKEKHGWRRTYSARKWHGSGLALILAQLLGPNKQKEKQALRLGLGEAIRFAAAAALHARDRAAAVRLSRAAEAGGRGRTPPVPAAAPHRHSHRPPRAKASIRGTATGRQRRELGNPV